MLLMNRLEKYYPVGRLYMYSTACYARVSTSSQDLKGQFEAAQKLADKLGIPEDEITWIEDDGVSAYRLDMDARPGIQELLNLIRDGKIKRVIVYSRDRLARNYYEYVAIVKEFYKYKVEVLFTSSNSAPFSKDLVIEAIYGAIAQSEAGNINSRTQDTLGLFPNSVFGFIKSVENNQLKYSPDPRFEKAISNMFQDVLSIQTAEELFLKLDKYKSLLKVDNYTKLVRYLSNPFYCGHTMMLSGMEKLKYVLPIISLSDYEVVQEKLGELNEELQKALTLSSNHAFVHPHCSKCHKPMSFRYGKLNESGYFVCSRNHKRISINCSDLNEIIKRRLEDIINKLDADIMKADLLDKLKRLDNKYTRSLKELDNQIKQNHFLITEEFNNSKAMNYLLKHTQEIKQEIETADFRLKEVANARRSINDYVSLIKKRLLEELKDYDLYYLIKLFFPKIEVDEEALIFHISLTKYFKDGDQIA